MVQQDSREGSCVKLVPFTCCLGEEQCASGRVEESLHWIFQFL